MLIMGLDISSSTIGISVLDYNKKIKIKSIEFYEPPSTQKVSLFESLLETKKFIIKKYKEVKPDCVVIEDIAEHFGGGSTSKTIIKLAIYNRTIGLTLFEEFGITPELINVNTVRSIIKPQGTSGRLPKEDVPMAIEKKLNIKFPYLFNKKGKIDVKTYDMADATAVALAYIIRDSEKK